MTLMDWVNGHGKFGKQLLDEWTGRDCLGNEYNIENIGYSSNKKVIWRCTKYRGYTWETTVNNRTNHLQCCPFCANKRCVTGVNDLYTWSLHNTDIGNTILKEWTGLKDDGTYVDMNKIMSKTNVVVKWQCQNDSSHTWYAPISRRTTNKSGCPHCKYENERIIKIEKLANRSETLDSWCNANGCWGNIIKREWTGKSKSGDIFNIEKIAARSNQNMLWRCSNGHEWYARIYDRTVNKCGCRQCSSIGTSRAELIIYYIMKQLYPGTIHRGKYMGYEFDIAIPEIKLCIEYGSMIWHYSKRDRDFIKYKLCQEHNVDFIEIMDITNYYGHIDKTGHTLYYRANYSAYIDDELISIIEKILNHYEKSLHDVDIDKAIQSAVYHRNKINTH